MKKSDFKQISLLYENQIIEEGILSDLIAGIRSKANELGLKAAGVAANVGNRLANNFRSGADQKNPVEAQVQKIWNNFRNECISIINNFEKNTSNLIDFDTNNNSPITLQHKAILEAKKFLESPQHYIKNNPSIASAGGSGSFGGGSGSSNPESSNSSGTSSGGGSVSGNSEPVLNNQPQSNQPQSNQPTKPVSAQVTNFLKDLRKNPALYKAVVDKIISKHKQKQQNKNIEESFFYKFNKNLINFYITEISNSEEMLKSVLMEYDVQQTVEKTKDSDAEDIRYHGAKPLKVEILKFFEQFRKASKKFIDAYDSVQKMGTYQRSEADKKIFITIEAFARTLARILYIKNAASLQGKNEFLAKM
jgi:hypothetical protein